MKYDAVILGSGIAGFSAAVALKRRNKNVLMLALGPGATAVSSGVWDFGPLAVNAPHSLEKAATTQEWKLVKERILVNDPELFAPESVENATREIAGALEADLPLHFSFSKPLVLPTSGGKWRRAFGAQKIQAASDLAGLLGKKPKFVFSKRWRMNGVEVCRRWNEGMIESRVDIQPLEIDFPKEGADWALPTLAARLSQHGPSRAAFETALKEALRNTETQHLLLPPIFVDLAWHAKLQKELGVVISECAATVEPVAGFRMDAAIRTTLQRLGVTRKEVVSVEPVVQGKQIQRIRYLESDGKTRGEAVDASLVLATGKLFAGGIRMNYESVEETVFGLPLFLDKKSEPVSRRGQIPWADRDFRDEQPWANLGLKLNESWRPVDVTGEAVYGNLYACGSLIGGLDFARHQVGFGFMSYSGRQCVGQIS